MESARVLLKRSECRISVPLLPVYQIIDEHAMIFIHDHAALGHVALRELSFHLARCDHLGLYIDDSTHYFLILPINSLSLLLLARVI